MVKQGDIVKINLDPKQGHEQQGYRPYICLSYHGAVSYTHLTLPTN
jgi:mRNA interferase MazF